MKCGPRLQIGCVCLGLLIAGQMLGCSKSPTDNGDLLPAPRLLQNPADTAMVEVGIDAVENSNAIQLDWQPGDDQKPAGYRLYRRDGQNGQFALVVSLSRNTTTYLDTTGVRTDTRYYYFLTAFNDDDKESTSSDTLSYTLLDKAFNLSNTLDTKPIFSWQINAFPQFYVLKLVEADTDRKIWVVQVKSDFTPPGDQVRFNADGSAIVDSLGHNISYRWRIDVIGPSTNSGSESLWKRFSIP